jgi:hypothetical protein
MKRKRPIPTRDSLPAGWTLARWDTTKAAIREVIWARALADDDPIGYEQLDQKLKLRGLGVGHQSSTMTGLLNELAEDVHKDAGCWVTTWVVLAGEKYSGKGLFDYVVPEREWKPLGKTKFCVRERKFARAWIVKNPLT